MAQNQRITAAAKRHSQAAAGKAFGKRKREARPKLRRGPSDAGNPAPRRLAKPPKT